MSLASFRNMGYVDYFLIVWDYIKLCPRPRYYGRTRDEARRQEALSPIHLALHSIDPVKYNLLFERFLNPERVSMPDIDVDFCFERRQEVIDYVVRKIRQRSGCTDRDLWYDGGKRRDP